MKFTRRQIIVFIAIVLALIGLKLSGLMNYFSLETLKENREHLKAIVDHSYILAVLLYILAFIIGVLSPLPLPALLTITGGFLFGVLPGIIYACIGATLGSILSFLIFRAFFGDKLQKRYAKQLKSFNHNMTLYGSNYILGVHFIGLIPFFIINALASLTSISLFNFTWTTAVGVIPSSIIFAFMGQKLSSVNSVYELFTPGVIIMFVILVLFSVLPVAWRKYKAKKNK